MEKERITISIKKNLLGSIDRTIDGIDIRNRSHAIETFVAKSLNQDGALNAIILVGGENALEKIPQVKDNLKKLASSGIENVIIAVGYLAKEIKDKIGDGSKYGLEVEYSEEGEGSGGAILPLKDEFDNTFIVVNDINIKNIEIDQILDFHKSAKSIATIVTNDIEKLNGLYLFEMSVFDYFPKGFSMLESDIFPKLIAEQKLTIKPF